MNFDELYPDLDTRIGEERFEGSIIIRGETYGTCGMCGNTTTYIDLCFEGHCCSTECNHQFWEEYAEAAMNAQEFEVATEFVARSSLKVNWKKEGF